jgi:hypothetical protein
MIDDRARELASMPYHAYLQTPEWRARADAAKARAGHRCQVCNRRGRLDAHHRTYERLGHEEDADLTVLCGGAGGCHELFSQAGKVKARPAPIGVVHDVPGATLWTVPAAPPPVSRWRPQLRVLRRTRRRWRETATTVRLGLVLLLAGTALLAVLSRVHPA